MKKVKDINKIGTFKDLSKKEKQKISGGGSSTGRDAVNTILAFFYPYL